MDDDRASRSGGQREENGPEKGDRASGATGAWTRALGDVAPYLDLGWRLAGTAAFPPLIGFAFDLWLDTTPWLLLGGCIFGLAGAGVQLKRLQADG